MFDAITLIMNHKAAMNNLMPRLDLPQLTDIDFQLLEEYLMIMEPVAKGLDFLQQEVNSYNLLWNIDSYSVCNRDKVAQHQRGSSER